jgi:hypothetical protein
MADTLTRQSHDARVAVLRCNGTWGCYARCGRYIRLGGWAVLFKGRKGGGMLFHPRCFRMWWPTHAHDFPLAGIADRPKYLREWRARRRAGEVDS